MKMVNVEATAEKIKKLMKENNVSANQLADETQVCLAAVYKWLGAKNLPGLISAKALADLFGLDNIEEIVVFEEIDNS